MLGLALKATGSGGSSVQDQPVHVLAEGKVCGAVTSPACTHITAAERVLEQVNLGHP